MLTSGTMREGDTWLLWIKLSTILLVFSSLWVVTLPTWHVLVSLTTLVLLWRSSEHPLRTLSFIVGLVGLLVLLQLLFSGFMRALLLRSLASGFHWEEWQYLFFAVERFAWPLAVVHTIGTGLTNSGSISRLMALLMPWKYLGFKVEKLQILLVLALRFIPTLRREWDRFAAFQNYFQGLQRPRTLVERLRYGQGVLKALIAHSFHRAVVLGDLLALKGLPGSQTPDPGHFPPVAGTLWLALAPLFVTLDLRLGVFWCVLSCWMVISAWSLRYGVRT